MAVGGFVDETTKRGIPATALNFVPGTMIIQGQSEVSILCICDAPDIGNGWARRKQDGNR